MWNMCECNVNVLHVFVPPHINACWISVIRRIFGYQRSESVNAMLHGLGRLNVKFQLLLLKVKFYKRLFFKTGLLHDVLWFYVLSDCDDKCSNTVFILLHTAVNNVMSEFYQYVDN